MFAQKSETFIGFPSECLNAFGAHIAEFVNLNYPFLMVTPILCTQASRIMGASVPLAAVETIAVEQHLSSFANAVIGVPSGSS